MDGQPTFTGECSPIVCGSNQLDPVYYQTCVLPAGTTSVECRYADITWHYGSFLYGWGDVTDFDFLFSDCTLIVTPGNNEWCSDWDPYRVGTPVTGGFGYAHVDAFVPPGAGAYTRPPPGGDGDYTGSSAHAASKSFTIKWEPIFKGAFTLVAKRTNGSIVRTRSLGVRSPAAYTSNFGCLSLRGTLVLFVRGLEHGHLQRSRSKTITC